VQFVKCQNARLTGTGIRVPLSGNRMLRYQTEMLDAGMPMHVASASMPVPSYDADCPFSARTGDHTSDTLLKRTLADCWTVTSAAAAHNKCQNTVPNFHLCAGLNCGPHCGIAYLDLDKDDLNAYALCLLILFGSNSWQLQRLRCQSDALTTWLYLIN